MSDSLKRASSRTWMYVAGALAAIALAVLVAISAAGGDDKPTGGQLVGVDEATALFAGIPQNGFTIGKADAPVTITEYLDAQCPHCASAAKGTLPTIVERHVKTGNAKLVLRPIAFLGPDSEKGALAMAAAAEQNKAAEMTEIILRNQGAENAGWITDGLLGDIASGIGLDVGKFNDARDGDAAKKAFADAKAAASAANVQGTPTFIISGASSQYTVQDYGNINEFEQAIGSVK